MRDVIDALRDELVAAGAVRLPNVAGPEPPAWKHPETGAIAPGDAKDQGRAEVTWDNGLVVSLMWSPGVPAGAGEEDRRRPGVDVYMRGVAVPAILDLETQVRGVLLDDPPQPGGRTDWVMGGLYVVQSIEWRPFQPITADERDFTFSVGYLFEVRA